MGKQINYTHEALVVLEELVSDTSELSTCCAAARILSGIFLYRLVVGGIGQVEQLDVTVDGNVHTLL